MSKSIFKKDKNGNVKIITKKNSFLAVILRQNKSVMFKWVSLDDTEFRHEKNTYFTVEEGMHLGKNRILMGVYIEGVSTPLGHRNIKKEQVEREIINDDGKKETVTVEIIEGLKYDSEIIDILLNRGLAEKFTDIKPDKTIFIMFVMIIINIVITGVAVGVEFL